MCSPPQGRLHHGLGLPRVCLNSTVSSPVLLAQPHDSPFRTSDMVELCTYSRLNNLTAKRSKIVHCALRSSSARLDEEKHRGFLSNAKLPNSFQLADPCTFGLGSRFCLSTPWNILLAVTLLQGSHRHPRARSTRCEIIA